MKKTQSELAAKYVSKMDAAVEGAGGDLQTFKVACKLVEFGLGSADAMTILKDYNLRCQPQWSESDLARKLKCAYNHTSPSQKFCDPKNVDATVEFKTVAREPAWPKINQQARDDIIFKASFGLSDLFDISPIQFFDRQTELILATLFPSDPLLCCGKSNREFWTMNRTAWGDDVALLSLIVPSAMTATEGLTKEGRKSAHTLATTGPRQYAVIEFDHGTTDDHAALLLHLCDYAPLVLAVHSGGKSLHGWFYVQGQPEEKIRRFYRYAVSLGADRATHTRSQFVRMPDGLRDGKIRQNVYYFNPQPITLNG